MRCSTIRRFRSEHNEGVVRLVKQKVADFDSSLPATQVHRKFSEIYVPRFAETIFLVEILVVVRCLSCSCGAPVAVAFLW